MAGEEGGRGRRWSHTQEQLLCPQPGPVVPLGADAKAVHCCSRQRQQGKPRHIPSACQEPEPAPGRGVNSHRRPSAVTSKGPQLGSDLHSCGRKGRNRVGAVLGAVPPPGAGGRAAGSYPCKHQTPPDTPKPFMGSSRPRHMPSPGAGRSAVAPLHADLEHALPDSTPVRPARSSANDGNNKINSSALPKAAGAPAGKNLFV